MLRGTELNPANGCGREDERPRDDESRGEAPLLNFRRFHAMFAKLLAHCVLNCGDGVEEGREGRSGEVRTSPK